MARTFNADERRAKREDVEVTVGGRTFGTAPQTTELRSILRTLGTEHDATEQEALQIAQNPATGEAEQRAQRERLIELDAQLEQIMYRMVAARLRDEDGNPPDIAWLSDALAPRDCGPMMEFLNEGGDDEKDPTSGTEGP